MVHRALAGLIITAAFFPAGAFQAGKTVQPTSCGELPPAVRAASAKEERARAANSTASCVKIVEDGQLLFEVKVTSPDGKLREMVYQPDGKLVEWEEESELASIPPNARKVLAEATGYGKLLKVDIIHRGALTLYEGEFRTDGSSAKKKLVVDASGRPPAR